MDLTFIPIWFDSLGAKSSCTLVKSDDVNILIDPGISVLQPSFPAPRGKKLQWFKEGLHAILSTIKNANIIIISHYHYDHFISTNVGIYANKILLVKNPNRYINESQRKRALKFFESLYKFFGNLELSSLLLEPKKREFYSPIEDLPQAMSRDFGDYNERRKELIEKGLKWFRERVRAWNSWKIIPEMKLCKVRVYFAESREFTFGNTKIRLSQPLFHGIEFSRLGWVFATIIENSGVKILHTSDINGPIIEDYCEWIIKEDPDILILDGPPTYLLGYTLNLINFKRAINNVMKIIKSTSRLKLIIYDHHLPREPKFKERTKDIWLIGEKEGKKVMTAAEYLGRKPVALNFLR